MFNNNLKYSSNPRPDVEYVINGGLKNYAFEAKCILNKVHIKIDIGHWGGNYGGETIPIGNTNRLSEYLSKEALDEVRKYAERLSLSEESWYWDIPYMENGIRKFIQLELNILGQEVFFEINYLKFNKTLELIKVDKLSREEFEFLFKSHSDDFSWLFPEIIYEINETLIDFEKAELLVSVESKHNFFFTKDNNCFAWIFNIDKTFVQEIRWEKGHVETIQWIEFRLPLQWSEHYYVLDYLYLKDLEVIKKRIGIDFIEFYGSNGDALEEVKANQQEMKINQNEIDAHIDLIMQRLNRLPQESALNVFKQIGEKIILNSPYTELIFELSHWKIGSKVLTFNDKEVEPFLDNDLNSLMKINELYVMKTSILLEIELNATIIQVQLDKMTGEILKVKIA
jgi:hypothetical protein